MVADGEVRDPAALSDALKRFVADEGLPKNVRLGVANQQIVVRVIELPRIEDEKQREAAVRFQAAEAIAMPLNEAILDHQVAGFAEAADGTPRMQVVLVAARRSMVESLLEAVKGAGLKAEGVDLDAFALVRTLVSGGDGADESARVFCHLAGVTNLAIAVGPACFFTRPLSAVWDDAGRRLAARRRDPPLDRLLHDPAPGAAGGRGRPVRARVRRRGARREPRRAPRPSRPRGLAARRPRHLGPRRSSEDPHRYTVAAGLSLGAAA